MSMVQLLWPVLLILIDRVGTVNVIWIVHVYQSKILSVLRQMLTLDLSPEEIRLIMNIRQC